MSQENDVISFLLELVKELRRENKQMKHEMFKRSAYDECKAQMREANNPQKSEMEKYRDYLSGVKSQQKQPSISGDFTENRGSHSEYERLAELER